MNMQILKRMVFTVGCIAIIILAGCTKEQPYAIEETSAYLPLNAARIVELTNRVQPVQLAEEPEPYDFPREFASLHITTIGPDAPFQVRELWIDSTFTLVAPNPGWEFEEVPGRIRGRGRSSWSRRDAREKRPLRIRFTGSDRERSMLGSPHVSRDWVLVSNHFDKSLLRNYSAYHLGTLLDSMDWSPFARSVHLYVNGEYMGVYLLVDERTVEPGRAQLTFDPDPAISEYFFEMDWRNYRNDAVENVDYIRVNSHPDGVIGSSRVGDGVFVRDHLYDFRFPRDEDMTTEHILYVRDFLTELGTAFRARDFEVIERMVNIDSLIDYYLVQELYQNVDAGFSSMFYQIRGQGDERRLYMGPLWDFDVAAGNAYWLNNQTPYRLYVSRRWYWADAIHNTPQLRERMIERWNDYVKDAIAEMLVHVRYIAETYEEDFERNFERHQIMGVEIWPNPEHVVEIDTFMGQVDFLIDFLQRRAAYLDRLFNDN